MSFVSDLFGGGNDTVNTSYDNTTDGTTSATFNNTNNTNTSAINNSSGTSNIGIGGALNPFITGGGGVPGLFGEAANLYNQGGMSYYPDQTYAGFDPLQNQGQDAALNFANSGMGGVVPNTVNANNLMTSGDLLRAESNPYLRQNVSDANSLIARDFNEMVNPSIGRSAQHQGQYGSSRHGIAEGIARRGVGEAISRNTNQMYNNAYNSGLNMMSTGVSQAPGVANLGLAPSNVMNQVGGVRQGMDQLGINDAVNAYNFNQNEPWNNLGRYQGILGGNYMGSGSTGVNTNTGMNTGSITGATGGTTTGTSSSTSSGTGTQPVTGSSPLGGAIGGGLAGFAATGQPWGAGLGALGGLL